MQAFETSGRVNKKGLLQISPDLLLKEGEVKVIIMYNEEPEETEWLKTITNNPAFDFLKEPEENIYSLTDGKPFHD